MGVPFLISFFIFLIIQFFHCQKIYNGEKIKHYMLYALAIPVILLLIFWSKDIIELLTIVNIGLLPFYFLLLLYVLKRNYKKLNETLIKKKAVEGFFSGKEFTYVFWDSEIAASWWDEKKASEPSWLDDLISFLLLIFPISIFGLINQLLDTFSSSAG